MINVFEQDFEIVPCQDLDYMQIDRVKKVELQNKYLTYGLIAAAVVIGAIAIIELSQLNQVREDKEFKA